MFLSLNVLENCQPGIRVEEVHIVRVDVQRDVLAGMRSGPRIHARDQRLALGRHVHQLFAAQVLDHIDGRMHRGAVAAPLLRIQRQILKILRANTQDQLLARGFARGWGVQRGHVYLAKVPDEDLGRVALGHHPDRVKEVHGRRADEAGHEQVGGMIVELLRRPQLLDDAGVEHRDARAHGHGFGLVMGHVDKGGLHALVDLGDLRARLHAQLGIQVGERLIQQEHLRRAHQCPPQRHALALPTGEFFGFALE